LAVSFDICFFEVTTLNEIMSKYYAPQPKQIKPKYIKPKDKPKVKPKVIVEGIVMSKIGQMKKGANWESSCARCENCLHFRDKRLYLVDSLPREAVRHCDKFGFRTNMNSICDAWVDKETKKSFVK
jgi:hypothetical protein